LSSKATTHAWNVDKNNSVVDYALGKTNGSLYIGEKVTKSFKSDTALSSYAVKVREKMEYFPKETELNKVYENWSKKKKDKNARK